jgi:hypothetical protein
LADNREVQPLKLTAEDFPLPCSLQKRVLERFTAAVSSAAAGVNMARDDLLNYLRNVDCEAFDPLEGILVQTEAIGDPAVPSLEQMTIMKWLDAAFSDWQRQFPLEEPLATELRRLKPLLAAVAISEPPFLTPGAHPLHQMMDTIQAYAIGWQPRLGRVGQTLEKQVGEIVEAALAWFDAPATDLAKISNQMVAAATKARAHADRMARRLAEAEQGRRKINGSKREAARMINAALEGHPATAEIGEFLKGPWYDSAQLALLKYGDQSPEWAQMVATTSRLLESLQPTAGDEAGASSRRQHLFELISELPGELRAGLLSLQHDRAAVDDAVDAIEKVHRELLRSQALQLQSIAPIPQASDAGTGAPAQAGLDEFREGQWFVLDTENSPSLRVALSLRNEEEQQLLFVNQAGMKVLEKSFAEFAAMVARDKVTRLDSGSSFSRSLAGSAGIETVDDLDQLTGVAAQKAKLREQERSELERERRRQELERAERERAEQERQQREQAMLEQLRLQEQEAERQRQQRAAAEQLRLEQAQQERLQMESEREATAQLREQWEYACCRYRDQPRSQPGKQSLPADTPGDGSLHIPRSTWVGFRNDEQVELALLAAHRREHDQYIFVDRYGRQLRKLSGRELLIVITRGVADILASRSRFRDEVGQAREQGEQWRPGSYDLDVQQAEDPRGRRGYRRQPGMPLENTVYIELVAPEFGSRKPGTLTRVRTEYIRRQGLDLAMEHALPTGAILQLAVELPGTACILYLVAEVLYSHPVPRSDAGPGWTASLELLDLDDSDSDRWLALVDSLQG